MQHGSKCGHPTYETLCRKLIEQSKDTVISPKYQNIFSRIVTYSRRENYHRYNCKRKLKLNLHVIKITFLLQPDTTRTTLGCSQSLVEPSATSACACVCPGRPKKDYRSPARVTKKTVLHITENYQKLTTAVQSVRPSVTY